MVSGIVACGKCFTRMVWRNVRAVNVIELIVANPGNSVTWLSRWRRESVEITVIIHDQLVVKCNDISQFTNKSSVNTMNSFSHW